MISVFVTPVSCSSEQSVDCRPNTEDSTCVENKTQLVQSQEILSVCNKPKLQICEERNKQPLSHDGKGLSQSKASASQRQECSIQPATEFSERPGQGEVVLVLAPKHHPSKVPHQGASVDQTATAFLLEGSTTTVRSSRGAGTDESHCQQTRVNETQSRDTVLSLPAALVHSSSLILRDGPMVSDLTENHTARGESSHRSPLQDSEPDEARLRPSPVPSDDFLPTFTSQRPPYLATRSTSSSNTVKQR